jgi:hypothetical protein
MNGWRLAACIFFATTITLVVRDAIYTSERNRASVERDRRLAALDAKIQELKAELSAAHEARRKPRDNGDRPAGEVPADSRTPFEEKKSAPAVPSDEERLVAARNRLRSLRAELPAVMAAHDGQKAVEILKELAKIAKDLPEARDDAMKLAVDINRDVNGQGELRLSQFAFYSALGDDAIRDLMLWSMENPGASTADFRVMSAYSIPWAYASEPDQAVARYDAALAKETDRGVQAAILSNLSDMNNPKAEALLAKLFQDATRDAGLRGDAALALATSTDPAILRSLESAAQTDADPRVQSAAKLSLVARDPPASGCLVTATTPDGVAEAAGMRAGDIIVSYNGRAVGTLQELVHERDAASAAAAESVPVLIVRDGREQTLNVKTGRLGLPNLRAVKKK